MFKRRYLVRQICAVNFRYRIERNFSTEYVVKSKLPSINYKKGNVTQFLFEDFHLYQDRVALRCMETKKTVTFFHLKDQTARWSGFLKRRGLRQGDTIAIFSPNCLEYVPVMLGAAAVGIATSPMNSLVTGGEIAHMLKINTPKMIAFASELEDSLLQGLSIAQQDPQLVSFGPSKKGSDIMQILASRDVPFEDPVDLDGKELFLIPFSSGTTGLPKGVAHSHNSFIINVQQACNPLGITIEKATESQQNSWFTALPFAHIGGVCAQMYGLEKGLRTTIMSKLNPDLYIQTIKEEKFTQMISVPFLLNILANHPGFSEKAMPHLKVFFAGGSPSPAPIVEIIKEKLGGDAKFQEIYGMTECLLTHLTPFNEVGGTGTMQLLPDVEAKVVDVETGLPLPPNQIGEICLRSPAKMNGYLNNPNATKQVLQEEGWMHSGDVGYYDEQGHFVIVDRVKDLIKVKSLQVSPSEIEEILIQHPQVRECCIIGIKDKYLGEAPKAFVIKNGNLTEQEIHDFLKTRLAKHKQLAGGIKFVDDFPRTNLGKVKRTVIRAENQ